MLEYFCGSCVSGILTILLHSCLLCDFNIKRDILIDMCQLRKLKLEDFEIQV